MEEEKKNIEERKNIILWRASLFFVVVVFVFLVLADIDIYLWILVLSAIIFGSSLNDRVPLSARRNRFILAAVLFAITVLLYVFAVPDRKEIERTSQLPIAAAGYKRNPPSLKGKPA